MSQSELEPETYGSKAATSVTSQPPLNDVATREDDQLPAIGEAQRFAATIATSDQSEATDLARIVAAWPRLRDQVKAAILELLET